MEGEEKGQKTAALWRFFSLLCLLPDTGMIHSATY